MDEKDVVLGRLTWGRAAVGGGGGGGPGGGGGGGGGAGIPKLQIPAEDHAH